MELRGSIRVVEYLLQPDGAKPINHRLGHASASTPGEALEMLEKIGYTAEELAQIRARLLPATQQKIVA